MAENKGGAIEFDTGQLDTIMGKKNCNYKWKLNFKKCSTYKWLHNYLASKWR